MAVGRGSYERDPYAVSRLVDEDMGDPYGAPPPPPRDVTAPQDESFTTHPEPPGGAPGGTSPPPPTTGSWGANWEWTPGASGPKVSDIQWGNTSQLGGYDTSRWGTGQRGSESAKNTLGRFMSQVDVTQPGASERLMALPGFRDFFPNARLVAHPKADQIDLFGEGDQHAVDVIVDAVEGGSGKSWAFQPKTIRSAPGMAQGGGTGAPTGTGPGGTTPLVDPVSGEPISPAAYQRLVAAGFVDPVTGQASEAYRMHQRSRVRDLISRDPADVYGGGPRGVGGDDLRTLL